MAEEVENVAVAPAKPRKPRKPRARKPKAEVGYQPAAAKPAESPARFVEVKSKRKPRGLLAGLATVILIMAVVVGACYIGWQELSRYRQESSKRDSELGMQVSTEVANLQAKFDSLMSEWDKQRREKEFMAAVKSYKDEASGLSFEYAAVLGDAVVGEGELAGTIRFSANPDITLYYPLADQDAAICRQPLQVSKNGYCDRVEISESIERVERAFPVYDEQEALTSVALEFIWSNDDSAILRLSADLGTPSVDGRDLFAPADEAQQQDQLENYFRSVLKGESIHPTVDENIRHLRQVAASLKLP